jgi:hypothetical protein
MLLCIQNKIKICEPGNQQKLARLYLLLIASVLFTTPHYLSPPSSLSQLGCSSERRTDKQITEVRRENRINGLA